MKDDFDGRISSASASELRVLTLLRNFEWDAHLIGQALFPPNLSTALKSYTNTDGQPSLIRWWPDIAASKMLAQTEVVLFDVKYEDPNRSNYSIEIRALEAAKAINRHLNTMTLFVWESTTTGDLLVMSPERVEKYAIPGPENVFGSGTPYVLVAKTYARTLSDVERFLCAARKKP